MIIKYYRTNLYCKSWVYRYYFPENKEGQIIFDMGAYLVLLKMDFLEVRQIDNWEIAGFSFMGKTGRRPQSTYEYFVA